MRPCPACDEATSLSAFALPGGDEMRRCAGCGSLFPAAPPNADEAYRDYYTAARRRSGWRRLARGLADATRPGYLDRGLPPESRRVLDYGCGDGAFLERVAEPGRRLFGVDRFAPERYAQGWTLLDQREIEAHAPYDWITLGHVLEHLDEPASVLLRLAGVLAPGGGLWIATPNANSALIRAAGALARDIDYPRHRQIFSTAGLQRLATRAGLAARFLSSPAINTALNAAQTLRLIAADRSRSPARRSRLGFEAAAAVARHWLSAGARRRGYAPELVAILRRDP